MTNDIWLSSGVPLEKLSVWEQVRFLKRQLRAVEEKARHQVSESASRAGAAERSVRDMARELSRERARADHAEARLKSLGADVGDGPSL
jgi:uncharacterized protein involved in exopolysaccharide biosynthesis